MLCFGLINTSSEITCNSATLPHKHPSHDRCQTSKSSTRHQILTGCRVTPVPSWRRSFYLLSLSSHALIRRPQSAEAIYTLLGFFGQYLWEPSLKNTCLCGSQTPFLLRKMASSNIMITTPESTLWCTSLLWIFVKEQHLFRGLETLTVKCLQCC